MTQDEAFKAWWYTEGSQPPFKHHDCEEHTMRMCEIAWANGAFKEREWLIEYIQEHQPSCKQMIKAIDARGQA